MCSRCGRRMDEGEQGRRLSRLKGAAVAFGQAMDLLRAGGDVGAAVSLLKQCLEVRAVQRTFWELQVSSTCA